MIDNQPFLTLITRCCWRPKMLSKAIDSALAQTSKDFEIVFIVDKNKRGVRWANQQFAENKHRIDGQYVYTLDDDTFLPSKYFVAKLKQVAEANKYPDVIMVKGSRPQLSPKILPKDTVWGHRERLKITSTNGACFVTKRQAWLDHCEDYGLRGSGDWNFMSALKSDGTLKFFWWDFIAKETQQLGRGKKFENCKANWWQRIVKKYGIELVSDNDWRLRL